MSRKTATRRQWIKCFLVCCSFFMARDTVVTRASGPPEHWNATSGGLVLSVSPFPSEGASSARRVILFSFSCATNGSVTVFVPRTVEHLCRVTLLDQKGRPAPKTRLGERVGSRYCLSGSRSQRLSDFDPPLRTYMQTADRGPSPLNVLFAPTEMFAIPRPGNYTLEIKFQVFVVSRKPGRPPFLRVQFPTISYPVTAWAEDVTEPRNRAFWRAAIGVAICLGGVLWLARQSRKQKGEKATPGLPSDDPGIRV